MISTTDILICTTTVLLCFYIWMKYHFSYWKRKNVPFLPPKPLIGNMGDIMGDIIFFRKSPAEVLQDMYNDEISENQPIVGLHLFHKPALLIRDPQLIKMIMVKDFNKFSNRYSSSDIHSDPLGGHNLFFMKNPIWKQMRIKLTPIFTSGKMKQMFSLVNDIGKKMDEYLCAIPVDPEKHSAPLELEEISALYTTDVIASIAYGVEANSLKNPNAEFRKNGRRIFDFTLYRAIEVTSFFFLPQIVGFFKFKLFSKESTKFLRDTFYYVMSEREKSGATRNDVIDTLISLKRTSQDSSNKSEIKFDGDVLVAQAALFFTAGFETSSLAMSYALYELSKKPEIQKRLRAEIKETLEKNDGDITYESVHNMPYLHMILQEVLRMYPPLSFLDRECTLAKGETEYSLQPYSDYAIPNGMPVLIPIYGIQRDPKYYSDPDEFNPERFAPENKDDITPFTNMPFGVGPHNCIGERLGLMQAKIGLVCFFKNHYVRPSGKTLKTMKLDKKALIIQPEGGIHCEMVRDPIFKESRCGINLG